MALCRDTNLNQIYECWSLNSDLQEIFGVSMGNLPSHIFRTLGSQNHIPQKLWYQQHCLEFLITLFFIHGHPCRKMPIQMSMCISNQVIFRNKRSSRMINQHQELIKHSDNDNFNVNYINFHEYSCIVFSFFFFLIIYLPLT